MADYSFASDNSAGACPEAMEAILAANQGFASGYGTDHVTAKAADLVREMLDADADVRFVASGTAANAVALAALCRPFEAVIAHEHAHICTDEAGAPGFFGHGLGLIPLKGLSGRIDPNALEAVFADPDVSYRQSPAVLSLTNATEYGTVYPTAYLSHLIQRAKARGLPVHLDGARLANAVATPYELDQPTFEITAALPGASAEAMVATVAEPLLHHVAPLTGVYRMTSQSADGSTRITLQFERTHDADAAARDLQAAITAADAQLPGDMDAPPSFRKLDRADPEFDLKALKTLGVDIAVIGGAKAGAALSEAIVLFDKTLSRRFDARLKQAGQLPSKGRFLSAPWIGMLESGAWVARARHANTMARKLAALMPFPLMHPVEANAVFVDMDDEALERLHAAGYFVYRFTDGSVRFMCSWATTADAVEALGEVLKGIV